MPPFANLLLGTARLVAAVFSAAALFASLGCGTEPAPPAWHECVKSSNWTGDGAAKRLMNLLSPYMTEEAFNNRYAWAKSRGVDHFNLFVCNHHDGEYAIRTDGYSIYGNSIDWAVDEHFCKVMLERINKIRDDGYGVIIWLVADDDGGWNTQLDRNWEQYCKDLKELGFFDHASIVVIGLETDEYWNASQAGNNMGILRKYYSGKTGIHCTAGKYDWGQCADIMFLQIDPKSSKKQIVSLITKAKKSLNKPVCMFELERAEHRRKALWALEAGAYAVGNW